MGVQNFELAIVNLLPFLLFYFSYSYITKPKQHQIIITKNIRETKIKIKIEIHR